MTKVPTDPNMTPEVRRFLDDRARAETQLQSDVEDALAAIPALASEAEAEAGTNNVNYMSALRVAQAIEALNPFARFFHAQDQKSSGTDGGTFTSGAWRRRTLNVEVKNTLTGASLASSQVSLPAGVYQVQARAPGNSVNSHQARLQNITTAATILEGSSARSFNEDAITDSIVAGQFTLAATSLIELQHRAEDTQVNDGFGLNAGLGTEVYAEIQLWKIS